MSGRPKPAEPWNATWEGVRRQMLESMLEPTPEQRLAWLEEALELAWRAGALAPKSADGT